MRSLKKIYLLNIAFILAFQPSFSQRYMSKSSEITFYSKAPMEDIDAVNTKGTSAFDVKSGNIAFSIPIRSFAFKNKLMQEHFNENYLESEKYPKATFKGKVTGFKEEGGVQNVSAEGDLTIHGVTKKIITTGEFEFKEGKIFLKSSFPVALQDYKIKIPKIVFYNIAEVIDVNMGFEYTKAN